LAHLRFPRPARSRIESRAGGIVVTGRPGAAALRRLGKALQHTAGTAGTVVLDLRGLTALEMTTARLIVQADLQIRAAGGRLVLVGGGSPIRRYLTQLGLHDLLELVDHPSSVAAGEAARQR
jgi:anti-anti-sigma regulatory factor